MAAAPDIAAPFGEDIRLPVADNASEGLRRLRAANARWRRLPWPPPFDRTVHALRCGDARNLSHIGDETAHLVVTSPPSWTLKGYPAHAGQPGAIERSTTMGPRSLASAGATRRALDVPSIGGKP